LARSLEERQKEAKRKLEILDKKAQIAKLKKEIKDSKRK
jgi:hypothetical protein